ncbi:MAG: hypothetical protein AAGE76_14035 [Pseudomonadota bacterium]
MRGGGGLGIGHVLGQRVIDDMQDRQPGLVRGGKPHGSGQRPVGADGQIGGGQDRFHGGQLPLLRL